MSAPRIVVERTGSIVRASVEAPTGFVWTDGWVHEMVEQGRGGADARRAVIAELRKRMAVGMDRCEIDDCDWCKREVTTMDPNANLREQEELLTQHHTIRLMSKADRDRLLDLRQALYDWIRDGGFEPDWSQCPHAAAYYGRG